MAFTDLDVDPQKIGGTVTWGVPGDTSLIAHYDVYFAESELGAEKALQASYPVGTNALVVAVGTDLESFTHAVVYLSSTLGEQSTPTQSAAIVDMTASPSNVAFVDRDLDEDELGGTITWTPPAPSAPVVAQEASPMEQQPEKSSKLVSLVKLWWSILHVSKPIIWSSSWGWGFRFHR